MRPIFPPDLDVLARVMLSLPDGKRAGAIADLVANADLADRFRKRTGRPHPEHGDGSLVALALRQRPVPLRAGCDSAYLSALSCVIDALARWRGRM